MVFLFTLVDAGLASPCLSNSGRLSLTGQYLSFQL